jgi:hypothetical protein
LTDFGSYRDRLSFRFMGIRYAPQPQRFTYPTLFKGSGEDASALEFGSQCAQGSNAGSEDWYVEPDRLFFLGKVSLWS